MSGWQFRLVGPTSRLVGPNARLVGPELLSLLWSLSFLFDPFLQQLPELGVPGRDPLPTDDVWRVWLGASPHLDFPPAGNLCCRLCLVPLLCVSDLSNPLTLPSCDSVSLVCFLFVLHFGGSDSAISGKVNHQFSPLFGYTCVCFHSVWTLLTYQCLVSGTHLLIV